MSVLVIIVLLILPGIAVYRSGLDPAWAAGYVVVISALSYWVYACDKRRAEKGEWRIPESQLHLLDLLGGWPGGFLAQRRLRHKCSKVGYQFVFWLIVLGYQIAAFDSLNQWQLTRAGLKWIEGAKQSF